MMNEILVLLTDPSASAVRYRIGAQLLMTGATAPIPPALASSQWHRAIIY